MTQQLMTPATGKGNKNATADQIEGALTGKYRQDLSASLPYGIDANGYARAVCGLLSASSDLLSCTKDSLLSSILAAARSGLDPASGGFYFVKYGNQCQFLLSYKGMVQLARECGAIVDCYARVVHAGDSLEWTCGANENITHQPSLEQDREKEPITHVYAVAILSDGRALFECWDRGRLDAHVGNHVKGASSKSSPWQKDFQAMARKTVIKQFFSSGRLPMSTALTTGANSEEATTEAGEVVDDAGDV